MCQFHLTNLHMIIVRFRGELLASFATQSECCHMPNFECFTHRQSHNSNEANVNVTATDENNVTALNVAQNTRILKRMITQFTTT